MVATAATCLRASKSFKLLLMRGADIYEGRTSYLHSPLVLMTDRWRPNPHEYRPAVHGGGEFIPLWNEIRKLMCSYLALWVRLYVAGPHSSHPRRSEAIRSWGPHVASFLTGDTLPRSWWSERIKSGVSNIWCSALGLLPE